jgi:hypothetical protein
MIAETKLQDQMSPHRVLNLNVLVDGLVVLLLIAVFLIGRSVTDKTIVETVIKTYFFNKLYGMTIFTFNLGIDIL